MKVEEGKLDAVNKGLIGLLVLMLFFVSVGSALGYIVYLTYDPNQSVSVDDDMENDEIMDGSQNTIEDSNEAKNKSINYEVNAAIASNANVSYWNSGPESPLTVLLYSDSEYSNNERANNVSPFTVQMVKIVMFDHHNKEIKLISVPRHMLAYVPGVGQHSLDMAFKAGGPQLAIETLAQSLQIKIDGYLNVSQHVFDGYIDERNVEQLNVQDDRMFEYRTMKRSQQQVEQMFQALTNDYHRANQSHFVHFIDNSETNLNNEQLVVMRDCFVHTNVATIKSLTVQGNAEAYDDKTFEIVSSEEIRRLQKRIQQFMLAMN